MADTHTLTDAELADAVTKATTKVQQAQAKAEQTAEDSRLAELQAEQQRRAEQARADQKQAERDWAEWFLDGGGFIRLKAELTEAERTARAAFITAVSDSPIGKAAAKFYAAVENRQHAVDLREYASALLQRSFNPVVFNNRTDLTAEVVNAIEAQAQALSSEHWETLRTTQPETGSREWVEGGKFVEDRVEEYHAPGPPDYGKPVRMRLNVTTGKTEITDPDFLAWQEEQKADAGPDNAPPAWVQKYTAETGAETPTRRQEIAAPERGQGWG